MSVSCWEFNAG
ncbi:hypothetical protein MZB74_03775 [Escherichia coli]|uniref:Protein YoaM n=3 Tax=Escherichia coli TaxID=562 RepID=YOAM_ECOLI|nr:MULTISPECIES: protein YoaM [Enterobacteriaceae]YP_010051189.1 protein YoaM [Escherichia coli str. K-12 substr. MG1655]P0DSF7.1 RecName: Full=Protein YoaM [Escherichia coli K-12]MBY0645103.1 hypothetical protein [Escherichia sp. NIC18-1]MBY0681488.1 hypothetical protein [Escherichia sp. NT35]MBY0697096.1 hypothetical protein [Escherichia sp. NT45]MBY0703416.1 hypothetical protein [Escherichia sp. M623]MBY0709681.1 hypothetical protein [Escherichia sp. M612]MBY0714503.1 hypothetical protei